MRALSAGLIFVCAATVAGLLLGMAAGGLAMLLAAVALIAGAIFAAAAALGTFDPPDSRPVRARNDRYHLWFWGLAAVFAVFALRSFCWLLYRDDAEWKIQSPNNLGDLALHITYIRLFANGVALWPDNPIYIASKMRYPAG